MTSIALWLLALALLLGGAAAISWLRSERARASGTLVAGHAAIALAGYGVLLVALPGARGGEATGTQSFGLIAAGLLGAALVAAVAMFALRARRRGVSGALVGSHATLAVMGFVMLAVYLALA
jgi:hypothetical protein